MMSAALKLETIASITDRSSSGGTAPPIRRHNARLLGSRPGGGLEEWLASAGGGDEDRSLSPKEPLSMPSESIGGPDSSYCLWYSLSLVISGIYQQRTLT